MGREYPESIPLPEACLMLASSSGIHYLTSSAWLPRFLHKPGKDDYSAPTSYRLIALLNTLVKALKLVVAKMIGYLAHVHDLLPKKHFGGRKGVSINHALLALVEEIRRAWAKGQVASLLLLDVSGAYDNISKERLLLNLQKRRLGGSSPGRGTS